MNLIGTALERSLNNKYYTDFKKTNPDAADEEYLWKCWMLKKYFKDNIIISAIKFVIGAILLSLAGSSTIYKILGHNGLGTIVVVACLMLGIILAGTGILYLFSNYRCLKNYKDHLWDEDGEIVPKIIKFYSKN